MSFKLLKQLILRQGVREFKDVVSVLNDFEQFYRQKLTVFDGFRTGKIKEFDFKQEFDFKHNFYDLTDVEKKLTVLEQTFSHDANFLKQIDKLRENLKEQQKLALGKTTDLEALSLKLKEEGELLALEEKLVEKAQEMYEKVDSEFWIKDTYDAFIVHGVEYLKQKITVAWYKNMYRGEFYTQDKWIKLKAKLPGVDIYYATFLALYKNKDGPYKALVEKMKQMFKKDFDNIFMMTSTRIRYNANGEDEIIHDYGGADESRIKINLIGENDYLNSNKIRPKIITSLLASDSKGEVVEVFEWISGLKPYLWRLQQKPEQDTERAVVLGRVIDGFVIDCVGYIGVRPARGVLVYAPREASKK